MPFRQKQEHLALELVRIVMNEVDIGIHIVDNAGVSVFYNRKSAGMDGLQPGEVIGRHILDVFPSLTPESSTILQVLQTGRPIHNRRQVFSNFRGKKIVTLNSTIPVVVDGKAAGAAEISYDITQVQNMADKLLALQVELYQNSRAGGTPEGSGGAKYNFEQIIGGSEAVRQLKELGLRAARSSSPVFVCGETGTGKELLVHAIHNASPRRNGPFIAQNCAALPATLLESILFGTVRGSFTGSENRLGLFELAHGGTLFLDEINLAEPELQVKLLRVLEEGCVRRVGDSRNRPVNVRIIVAANVPAAQILAGGQLRADLFYRLNVVSLNVPPLRERPGDIPLLTSHFIRQICGQLGVPEVSVSPAAMSRLTGYSWPGNIRQLKHQIEGLINLLDRGEITAGDLRPELEGEAVPLPALKVSPGSEFVEGGAFSLPQALSDFEKKLIQEAMDRAKGNVAEAARFLSIPRQTLQYKLKMHKVNKAEIRT